MKKDNLVYLKDILTAIVKIEDYLKGVDYEEFQQEFMRQDAVIRQLEIIGEAVNKLSSDFRKDNPDFPVKEAINMRNFLIHGYSDIDLPTVWKTVQENIPFLKERVENLLIKTT